MLVVLPRYQHFNPQESPRDPGRSEVPIGGPYAFEPFRFFQQKAPASTFPIHSLVPDFQRRLDAFPVCFEDDFHWDLNGNVVAAEAIARYLLADGVLTGVQRPAPAQQDRTEVRDLALPLPRRHAVRKPRG